MKNHVIQKRKRETCEFDKIKKVEQTMHFQSFKRLYSVNNLIKFGEEKEKINFVICLQFFSELKIEKY